MEAMFLKNVGCLSMDYTALYPRRKKLLHFSDSDMRCLAPRQLSIDVRTLTWIFDGLVRTELAL
jgi:hypothetical protein